MLIISNSYHVGGFVVLYQIIEEQQASSSHQVGIEANVLLEEKQRQVLNQFPFLGEEQPISLLQLVSLPPYRPCLVQPMQSDLGKANFHQQ